MLRIGLLILAAIQATLGLWALSAPRSPVGTVLQLVVTAGLFAGVASVENPSRSEWVVPSRRGMDGRQAQQFVLTWRLPAKAAPEPTPPVP